jgi:hypothetical protein
MKPWVPESFLAWYVPHRRRTWIVQIVAKREFGNRIEYHCFRSGKDEEYIICERNLRRITSCT